jgi:hypothetical protein
MSAVERKSDPKTVVPAVAGRPTPPFPRRLKPRSGW